MRAIELFKYQGESCEKISETLGVSRQLIMYWIKKNDQTFTIIVPAWIVPVVTNRVAYASNLRALRNAVLQSEALFLNQYSGRGSIAERGYWC